MQSQALPSFDRLHEVFQPNFMRGELICKIQRGNRKPGEVAGFLTGDKRYLMVGIDYKTYYVHRIMYALYHHVDPGDMEVDHIDLDMHDNRAANLRLATRAQNGQNLAKRRIGPKGAYRNSATGKPWVSTIKANGVSYFLGLFDTEEEAHEAYVKASTLHHGKFGRAN